MHVEPNPAADLEIREKMEKLFKVLPEPKTDGIFATLEDKADKDRAERFMKDHKDEIQRGLIAPPGASVQTRGGTVYDVADDGSWRKRK